MLAFAVRGVVLLGVLSWYSASMWKMIDSYFKDQFRTYLQDEYHKDPRIKIDLENAKRKIVDKEIVPLPVESSLKYGIAETYDPETCPADIIDACQQTIGSLSGKSEESTASGAGENAVGTIGVGLDDKNAFPENAFPGRSDLESRKLSSGNEERRPRAVNRNGDRENEEIEESPAPSFSHDRLNKRRLSEATKETMKGISREKPKKRRVNTVARTDASFTSARIRNEADDDFLEFEEEEGRRVREEGILVSELPFKPKADIGRLDRVTAEEFCPLTLEDEASCGETTTWP